MNRLFKTALAGLMMAGATAAAAWACPQCEGTCNANCSWAIPGSGDEFICYNTCMPLCQSNYCPMSGL